MFRFLQPSAFLVLLVLPLVHPQTSPRLYECHIDAEYREANEAFCRHVLRSGPSLIGRIFGMGRCADCTTPSVVLFGLRFYCGNSPCRRSRCAECTIRHPRMIDGVSLTDRLVQCMRKLKKRGETVKGSLDAGKTCAKQAGPVRGK